MLQEEAIFKPDKQLSCSRNFQGALDARITSITDKMKIAAAHALANSIKPSRKKILPSTLDKSVAAKIAKAVIAASKNE